MDRIDGKTVGLGVREEDFQAIAGTSHGTVIEGLYRILSVALPTFDQPLRLLSGDSQEWLGCAGQESAAYSHAFSKMVDLGVDEEGAFTQDLLQRRTAGARSRGTTDDEHISQGSGRLRRIEVAPLGSPNLIP